MKIIKAGTLPATSDTLTGQCSKCGCQVECHKDEPIARHVDYCYCGETRGETRYVLCGHVTCPTLDCGAIIFLRESAPVEKA